MHVEKLKVARFLNGFTVPFALPAASHYCGPIFTTRKGVMLVYSFKSATSFNGDVKLNAARECKCLVQSAEQRSKAARRFRVGFVYTMI